MSNAKKMIEKVRKGQAATSVLEAEKDSKATKGEFTTPQLTELIHNWTNSSEFDKVVSKLANIADEIVNDLGGDSLKDSEKRRAYALALEQIADAVKDGLGDKG